MTNNNDDTMAIDSSNKKRKTTEPESSSAQTQLALSSKQPESSATGGPHNEAELLFREHTRLTLDINPLYLTKLQDRRELGYRRYVSGKKLEVLYLNIVVPEVRRCLHQVLERALRVRYYDQGHLRDSEIEEELEQIVPLTVSACMCALYAKLRNIHRAYGKVQTRYTTPPHYTKEVELPLPLAIAIQDFGSFETASLETNYVLTPTYPEGTNHEGRADADFNITDYQSYIPTFKELGIPCKTVDPFIKRGTAWWTYQVSNAEGTSDLQCILPPSLYSSLSAQVRMLFLATKPNSNECSDIIDFTSHTIVNYGTRLREAPPNSNVRAFLALCHRPEEEWSNGAPDM